MSILSRFFKNFFQNQSIHNDVDSSSDKKSVSVKELKYALFQLAQGSDDTDEVILRHFKENTDINLDRVRDELFCLRIFIIDFTVWASRLNENEKNVLLDTFYDVLKEVFQQLPDSSDYNDYIQGRIMKYSSAIKEPSDHGPGWPVAKAFSKFCGSEDILTITKGFVEFNTSLKMFSNVINQYKITG